MNEEAKPLIYIVDDDPSIRDMIELMVDSVGYDYQSFADASEFLEAYQDVHGCLLLDIRMPGMSGMMLQERLNEQRCIMPIIFITGHGDITMAVEAMQRGAFDFMEKPFREFDLLSKIEKALELDEQNRVDLTMKQEICERIESLTKREKEVMELVAQGKANKVIAIDLNIAQGTVEIHRSRIMSKMKARSLAHLMRMLMVAGELDNSI
ncbi:response regulator transcription factor [Celerinatantimonas diazotrophica]|uniref:LuxR family two component transcriptional regulator n=1 Tax=Celerinatantimonas diazotrophica TaxID=412034 RepID=A0A4R1KIP1_9GAMM|nr:response regulator [Celerinatantimonas diazotrophica]TCK63289.1 LuxR family two component transcriptional regulator [Celerinatantimonas diazotrophica]CAG9298433.1 Response regulator protein TmoT [Celerinatantimonas diazotrophica]